MASPSLELAALCERDPDRGYAFRSRVPDVPIETDFDKLLLDSRLDAVLVATPPSTHYALCRQALQAGKHVLDVATHPPRSGLPADISWGAGRTEIGVQAPWSAFARAGIFVRSPHHPNPGDLHADEDPHHRHHRCPGRARVRCSRRRWPYRRNFPQ